MIRTSIVMVLLLTAITGFIYPLVMTGVARVVFPDQAAGSLIVASRPGHRFAPSGPSVR